jgi:predicted nucleic acid-binding Zn ribbon protein
LVFGGWADAVGPQVAAHARPVSLAEGTLVVAVDEPAWATQIRFLTGDILRRLAELAGSEAVVAIEIRVRR